MNWAYKGIPSSNKTAFIVQDYLNKKMLASLGYRFDPEELETWQVEAYSLITHTVSELERKEMEKNSKRKK